MVGLRQRPQERQEPAIAATGHIRFVDRLLRLHVAPLDPATALAVATASLMALGRPAQLAAAARFAGAAAAVWVIARASPSSSGRPRPPTRRPSRRKTS